MRPIISLLFVAPIALALFGGGGTPQPQAPPTVPKSEADGRPRQIHRQVTVMGKNGPETVTITETVTDSTQKMPVMPAEPIKTLPKTRTLPRDASPPQAMQKLPPPREKQP
ncbi:MAG: hypothetical protein ACRELF_22670 [Gemmataceae bacterium]